MILTKNIENLTKGSHKKINVICDICNREIIMEYRTYFKNTKNFTEKYYCHKCSIIKIKSTNLKKYGCVAPLQNKNILQNMIETNIKKYGVEHSSQLDEYKIKQKNTNLKKYGYTSPLKNLELRKKGNVKKFGVEFPIQNSEIKNKIEKTNLKKYGVKNTLQCKELREKGYLKIREKTLFDNNIIRIDDNNYIIKCEICHNEVPLDKSIFYSRKKYKTLLCPNCNPIQKQVSGNEILLQQFVEKNYREISINVKNIIKPYELDIYLSNLKLAFEYNGIYWHNELYKDKNYHLNKTEECEKNGIQLIHIYEDDWIYKQDIVKSIILSKLGKIENKIYARKCEIKEIKDNKLVKEFLENNHIQGFIGSKVKVGLFYNEELVSLMTFGDRRVAMGKKSTNQDEYEMLRFCNKLNTNVIGGASKLFKYFIDNYKPKEITTYADRSFSQGKLYEILGFKFVGKTKPNYYYVIDGIRHHRFNFRKDKLIREGFDANKTEHEIMLERNIYRIFDSGNLKFIYS